MKKRINNLLIIIIFTLLIIFIFFNRIVVTTTAINSVEIWLTRVFPTLFIMFIISDILIKYNFAYYFKKLFGVIFSKIFKLSDNAVMAFVLSLISGSPASAYIINDLFSNNKIDKCEANRLLKFTFFTNPLFLYNILFIIFNNNIISLKIIFSIYLSNIILAVILPSKNKGYAKIAYNISNDRFGVFLVKSIKSSINNIILILGSITFFMIIGSIVTMQVDNIYLKSILTGIFEITSGLELISTLNISQNIKEIIVTLIISFGGLAIHSQVYSMIYTSKLSYIPFLKGRLYACLLSILIIVII